VSYLFFGWFWTHGGQTLGMQARKIRITRLDGAPIHWRQALLRAVMATGSWLFLGLGFAWIFIDQNRQSWHDHLSRSRLIMTYN